VKTAVQSGARGGGFPISMFLLSGPQVKKKSPKPYMFFTKLFLQQAFRNLFEEVVSSFLSKTTPLRLAEIKSITPKQNSDGAYILNCEHLNCINSSLRWGWYQWEEGGCGERV
jgi:hypothetical protein